MRQPVLRFIVVAAFINAIPAPGQINPRIREPVSDELMGSGREGDTASLSRRANKRPKTGPGAAGPQASALNVLLVEDNDRLASLLQRGLHAAGFVVDISATAADAGAAMQTDRYDLVVLDRGLPDADGLTVLTDMRSRGDATPVVIITARGTAEDRYAGMHSGANDYLVKPFALDDLIARLTILARPA